ncbi:MAG: hypothetical protein ABI361_02875 [Nitrososphaera sp.]
MAKLNNSAVALGLMLVALLVGSLVPSISYASAQSQGSQTVSSQTSDNNQRAPTQNEILKTALSGPVFLNAYWVDQSASQGSSSSSSSSSSSTSTTSTVNRKQVGPGDGAATLAVVLVDRGLSDITAIQGHLTLPYGFMPNGARFGPNVADATFNTLVTAGNTFTLYFDVNVTNKTSVGAYVGSLDVQYSQVLSVGSDFHNQIDVPFQLSGRVILDTAALTHNLTPGVANDVNFQIINRGSAPATGVVVSITGISTSGTSSSGGSSVNINGGNDVRVTNFGARTFSVGTIAPRSNTTLTASLFPSNTAGSSTTSVTLQVTYNDPYGNTQTLNPSLSLFVLPSAPSLISVVGGTNGNVSDNRVVAGSVSNFTLVVSNRGSSPITNAVVSLSSGSSSVQILGETKWTVDSIGAQSNAALSTRIYASPSLIGTPVNFSVTIDYLTSGQSKTEQYTIGTYVDGDINLSTYGLALTYVGAAPSIGGGGGGFGGGGNTNAAGGGAGTPTLTGNILNKGNTVALFTTVQLLQVQDLNGTSLGGRFRQGGFGAGTGQAGQQGSFGAGQDQQPPFGQQGRAFGGQNSTQAPGGRGFGGGRGSQALQPQYLGDVTADSPMPFSITLDNLRNTTAAPLRVTLLITYSDGLRNPHQMTVTQVVFPQSSGLEFRNRGAAGPFAFFGPYSDYAIPIIIGIIAVIAAVIAFVVIRRRKAKARRLRAAANSTGGEGNIEDILQEPGSEKGSSTRKDSRLK